MCRLLAYLADEPVSLQELIVEHPHSLWKQSYAPRMQRYGTINADGFGAGWYDHAVRAEPARYRRAVPMWTDRSFASFAPLVTSTAIVASVRSATPPLPIEETGTAPFTQGPWLFAHNGAVERFSLGAGQALRRELSDERAQQILGASDSEVLFAMILDRIDAGADAATACVETIGRAKELSGGRFNFVMSDGRAVVATRYGDTLFVVRDRMRTGSVVIASEPFDEDDGWEEVPDVSVVEVAGGHVKVKPL